jgi:arginyl-tRNA--protein-N-Asp/Glu arginylyltransferase
MQYSPRTQPRNFFVTGPLPCPYLSGRIERRVVVELAGRDVVSFHDKLSASGYRRSHGIAYAPVCAGCDECRAVRIRAADFQRNRAQRRNLRRNSDLTLTLHDPVATEEQYWLFHAYQRHRHGGGEMAKMDMIDYRALIEETPLDTFIVQARDQSGVLLGVCLVDRWADGLSAVYSFFDPIHSDRGLGTYLILWTIEHARAGGRQHVYLGYWVAGSPKMAYKNKFKPLEVYRNGRWIPWIERAE